jgi:hypothetical protein
LPKFNGVTFNGVRDIIVIEHIKIYECILCLKNIVEENVVCRLFPFMFKGKINNSIIS